MNTKDPLVESILEGMYGGKRGGDGSLIERLTRENEQLKEARRKDAETIKTLREARAFYQENYRKAKAAYDRLKATQ